MHIKTTKNSNENSQNGENQAEITGQQLEKDGIKNED